MNNPISVVIPLYNKEKYIKRALNSVLEQVYSAQEIIVIDDGSTDNSAQVVRNEYPGVRLISQKNGGVSSARNAGLTAAKNSLVAFLDADDQFCPEHLYHLNQLYNQFPSFAVYGNDYSQVSHSPKKLSDVSYHVKNYVSQYSTVGGLVHSSTVLINKEFIESSEIFPKGVTMGEDVYAWVKLSSPYNGRIPVSSYVGAIYHDDSDGVMNSGKPKPFPEVLKKTSPLRTIEFSLTEEFEKHFLEDYVRSVYKFGSRIDLVIALAKVRKPYVAKFALKLFMPSRVLGYLKRAHVA